MSNHIGFLGFYGHDNTGDDLFCRVLDWINIHQWNNSQSSFFTDRLPEFDDFTPKNVFRTKKIKGQQLIEFGLVINKFDWVIHGGGSVFHSPINLTHRYSFLQRAAKKEKLNIGAIGVSLGPYKDTRSENDIIEYLKHLKFLVLRDQYSYDLAKSYNLPYEPVRGFDLAALLPKFYSPRVQPTQSRKIVTIIPCLYETYFDGDKAGHDHDRIRNLSQILDSLYQKDPSLVFRFVVYNGGSIRSDHDICMELMNKLNVKAQKEFIPFSTAQNAIDNTLESSFVLSIRLHGAIIPCFFGIPFYLYEYHRKCSDFLDDVGYDQKIRGDFDSELLADEIIKIIYDQTLFKMTNKTEMEQFASLNITVPMNNF